MKEIDKKLEQWVYNSIIRAEIRELIVKECFKSFDLGVEHRLDEFLDVEDTKHKLNTNTNG